MLAHPGVLAVLLLTGSAPCQEDPTPADLVVLGRTYTADPDQPWVEGVAIRGARILLVGDEAELAPWIGAGTRVLRAGDGVVVPGFNDAHTHFTIASGLRYDLELFEAESLEEIQEALRAFVEAHPDAPMVRGQGWDLADMPDHAFPTKEDLDAVVSDRPVMLWSDGPHCVWANSAALERAGIGPDTAVPPATVFRRDAQGAPTGVFLGRGLFGLFRFVPFPDLEEVREGMRRGLAEAPTLGITTVHDPVPSLLLSDLASLADAGELTLRFHVWGALTPGPFGGGAGQHLQLAEQVGRDHWITFGTLKGGTDGMPGLRTAGMLEPYADDPTTCGLLSTNLEELSADVAAAHASGMRVALHATGDAGVRLALDAIVASEAGAGLANRVEHVFVVTPEDVERFAAAGVVASVQPGFLAQDLAKDDVYERRFGKQRCADVLPLRSLLDAGVVVAFGTDYSLNPLDPRVGLYAAVTRRTLDGRPVGGWHPEQRITMEEAVRAYTLGSAIAEGAAEDKGTLIPGRLADLVVFAEDLFAAEGPEILSCPIRATILGGQVVYER